jgi:hypothetical protein
MLLLSFPLAPLFYFLIGTSHIVDLSTSLSDFKLEFLSYSDNESDVAPKRQERMKEKGLRN